MASKRAAQLLAIRSSSTVLRTQCHVPRRVAQATASARHAAPRMGLVEQRRWHSAFPSELKSKIYEFEDIKKVVEDPTSSSVVLIDVREPSEYNHNSIPTSFNIPVTSQPDALLLPPDEFEDRFGFQKPPVTKEVVFYCKAGVRSSAAAQIAKQAGYKHVGEYRGSMIDWEKKGGATFDGPSGATEPRDTPTS